MVVPAWVRDDLRRFRLHSWKHRGWMVRNWWHGYRFAAVERCRDCDHTTPYHYTTCKRHYDSLAPQDQVDFIAHTEGLGFDAALDEWDRRRKAASA